MQHENVRLQFADTHKDNLNVGDVLWSEQTQTETFGLRTPSETTMPTVTYEDGNIML